MGDNLTTVEAQAVDHLMPGNDLYKVGTKLKKISDLANGVDAIDLSKLTVSTILTTGSLITTGTNWMAHSLAGACAVKVMAS